jgi:hypothetical protein
MPKEKEKDSSHLDILKVEDWGLLMTCLITVVVINVTGKWCIRWYYGKYRIPC